MMNFNKRHNRDTISKFRSGKPVGNCELQLGYGFIIRFSVYKPDDIVGASEYNAELLKRYESGDEIKIKRIEETIFSYKKNNSMALHFQKKAYRIMMGIVMKYFGIQRYEKQRKQILNNVHGFR